MNKEQADAQLKEWADLINTTEEEVRMTIIEYMSRAYDLGAKHSREKQAIEKIPRLRVNNGFELTPFTGEMLKTQMGPETSWADVQHYLDTHTIYLSHATLKDTEAVEKHYYMVGSYRLYADASDIIATKQKEEQA